MPLTRRRAAPLLAFAALATALSGCASSASTPADGGWIKPSPIARPSALATPGPSVVPVSSAAPGPSVVASPAPSVASISALPITSNLWAGTSDLLFDVYDADFDSLTNTMVPVSYRLEQPDGETSLWFPTEIVQPTPGQRRMYRARLDLDEVGTWRLHVGTADGTELETVMDLPVLPDDGSPPLGAAFPAVHTPTGASTMNVPGGLATISTVPAADPAFYERSVDELLARGEPFLFTIDSVGFRTTVTCGAGLGHLIHLHHELPTMRMVHAEPYRMTLQDGQLVLDSPDGNPVPTDWAAALGATEPPWIFVVGADGRLWAKFHGIFGSDELRSAIDTVLNDRT